jgi:hypothetical protein
MFEKIGNYLLKLSSNKKRNVALDKLKKQTFVSVYFKQAMEKGEMETEPYFTLSDGREVFLSKLGSISYENYIMATQEIPIQYEQFGLRREKLLMIHEKAMNEIREAQVIMAGDPSVAHDHLATASNLIAGIGAEVAFGSAVRRHLEQCMCFLHTKDMNPYNYDYTAKQGLMYGILNEWDRLSFFLESLKFLTYLGFVEPSSTDSTDYLEMQELMDRPEIKLQLATLQRLGLQASSDEKEMSKEIISEFLITRKLLQIASS